MPSTHNAASAGQKVTLGENAPITQEKAGTVPLGSLAAQSSDFQASNKGSEPEKVDTSSAPLNGERESNSNDVQQGAPAPTYVNNQYYRDPSGPHGKNLNEGGFRTDEVKENKSFTADIGAEDDPSREALRNFERMNQTGGPGRGGKQFEITGDNEYGRLKAETSA